MTGQKPTINDLFTDGGIFDESEVVSAIQPHVAIQKDTNEILPRNSDLSIEKRILVYGLAKKLLKVKGYIEDDSMTPREFHDKTGVKQGSVDPSFKKLKDAGLLVGKSKSEIPNFKIAQIIKSLT